MPVVGYLSNSSAEGSAYLKAAFEKGLEEAGFVIGRNVAIEYRYAEGRSELLPAMAAELVRRPVAVLAAGGGSEARIAAKRATTAIPIVFASGSDPVREGLVKSLNRPDGNVTGVTFLNTLIESKRFGVLNELVPGTSPIAVLVDPNIASLPIQVEDTRAAAQAAGRAAEIIRVASPQGVADAYDAASSRHAGAIMVAASPMFNRARRRLVELSAQHRIPTIYESREYVEAGGLAAYGASVSDAYRELGAYAGRILKGTKPAELPVLQSTKLELVLNLNTAKALGLRIPQSVLLRADAVIQ